MRWQSSDIIYRGFQSDLLPWDSGWPTSSHSAISFLLEKTVCVAATVTQEIDLSLASGSAHLSVDSSNATSFSMDI